MSELALGQKRAFLLAYLNGALWALGNGLGSTALIVYLVRQHGAAGLGIGAILAAPQLVGVLRLAAPTLVGRIAGRRGFCMSCYGAAACLLGAIAALANPALVASPIVALPLMVGLWCVYHLLEYLATVVLWSWLGDIAAVDIRGSFIGVRESCMLVARIWGMLLAGLFSWWWTNIAPATSAWVGYSLPAGAAALFMLAAVLPLAHLPDPRAGSPPPKLLRNFFAPLADARMQWLLAFGICFSMANGLTQSAQYLFPIVAFGLPLLARNVYISGMRIGQASLAPFVGMYADRFGNRRVLIAAQLVVATGPVFFLLAKWVPENSSEPTFLWPAAWWMLGGAWIAWIAYVGLNVGLPNLMLKLAGSDDKSSYVAWYFAVTGVVYGLSTITGGALYSWLEATKPVLSMAAFELDHNDCVFIAGFLLRIIAVLWLLPLQEK